MTSQADNVLLTGTGPGTPCGALMRRYWQPVALADALPPAGPPLPVRLLGEDLVLGDGMAPPVSGQVSHGLMVVWQGRQIRLAPEEIVSVYRLPPEK